MAENSALEDRVDDYIDLVLGWLCLIILLLAFGSLFVPKNFFN